VHYAAFIRDISEKVHLQEKSVENERLAAIGVTAAKLAHEIGNPLNGMTPSLQLPEQRLVSTTSDDKSMEQVRGLSEQIARLTQLLQEFRNLSRRQDYRLVPTNLSELVTEVLAAETENYAARGVTLVHDSAPDLPLVKADAAKLSQVLVSLCKNAVEAMPNGGTLTVSVQHDDHKRLQLYVTDTGSGIPDGVNIFEPFITTKPEGTGLGLPVVRQIVAAHGGTLTYRSAPGQGATFTVTLAAIDEATHFPPDILASAPRTGEGNVSLCELLTKPVGLVVELPLLVIVWS
jgi:signal transduction histidine kinase